MTLITIDQFTGPFSLLLSLIEDEKLSISELSLSDVTEQYLVYLDTLEDKKAEELSDFLVVASRLLLLKARLLLPQLLPDEEEGPNLADQLRLYKMFVKASRTIQNYWVSSQMSFGRIEPIQKSGGFIIPKNVSTETLHESMVSLIKKMRPPKPLPEIQIDRAVSMKDAIVRIRSIFKTFKKFTFDDCLENKENKTEVLINFLAILELVKQRFLVLQQSDTFGTIRIHKFKSE